MISSSNDYPGNSHKADGTGGQLTTNIIMLYLALIGVGMIGGFVTFYTMFQSSCQDLLQETLRRNDFSMFDLEEKYKKALEDYEKCKDTAQATQELHEMKGRVQAHTELAERHQDLLGKHEKILARVTELQRSQDSSAGTIQDLRTEVRDLQNELDTRTQELREVNSQKSMVQASLQKRLEMSQNLLQEKMKLISTLQGDSDICNKTSDELNHQIHLLQIYISRRQHGMTLLRYGDSPYIVQFTVAFPREQQEGGQQTPHPTASFEVLIDTVNELPHAAGTFLNLVQHNFYDGTNFVFGNDEIIKGGHPSNAHSSVRAKTQRKYAEFGYGIHPLSFIEQSPNSPSTSTVSCPKYGLSFSDRGPDLIIHIHDDPNIRSTANEFNNPCIGKVIRGFDALQRFVYYPKDSEGNLQRFVNIVNARILGQSEKPESIHDEF